MDRARACVCVWGGRFSGIRYQVYQNAAVSRRDRRRVSLVKIFSALCLGEHARCPWVARQASRLLGARSCTLLAGDSDRHLVGVQVYLPDYFASAQPVHASTTATRVVSGHDPCVVHQLVAVYWS